ncbi:MAG: Uma2 family endonuclease, partial [Candidatus Competibacteraceae bacterium]|nr:Uma2 family endonuclease [Candidatus Competibacteraceae bacterium]
MRRGRAAKRAINSILTVILHQVRQGFRNSVMGADVGISPEAGTLQAPDVVVRTTPPSGDSAWLTGAPPLAVEYAGPGQDQRELKDKIAELLAAGTQQVWVVRLVGPQRVEVHRSNQPMQIYAASDVLEFPGVLRNPVPVRALFDRDAAHEVVLR